MLSVVHVVGLLALGKALHCAWQNRPRRVVEQVDAPAVPAFWFELEQCAPCSGDRFKFSLRGLIYRAETTPGSTPSGGVATMTEKLSPAELSCFVEGLEGAGLWSCVPQSAPPHALVWSYHISAEFENLQRHIYFRGEAGNTTLTHFLWSSLPGQAKRKIAARLAAQRIAAVSSAL